MRRSLFLFLVCSALVNGCVTNEQQPNPSDVPSSRKAETCHNQTYDCIKVFGEVYAQVQKHYVEEVDRQSLIHAAIKEMLDMLQPSAGTSNLDSYTHQACSTDYECLKLLIQVLTEIQKQYGKNVDLDQVVEAAIRGMLKPLDSNTIYLKTEIGNPVKGDIQNESVFSKVINEKIGYIRITQFEKGTPKSLRKTLSAFQAQDIPACILDIRNNSGGFVTAAAEVAELFLGNNKVVFYTKDRRDRKDEWVTRPEGERFQGFRLIVLINQGTAGGSEIVAGALQDWGIATLIGTRTLGRGTVQSLLLLGNGAKLSLTTSRSFTPKDRALLAAIQPDVVVQEQEGFDAPLSFALTELRTKLQH